MAPRRGGKEAPATKSKHMDQPALDAGHDTPPMPLRSSPRLREKEFRQRWGKDTPPAEDRAHVQTPSSNNPRPKKKLMKMFEEKESAQYDEQVAAKQEAGDKKKADGKGDDGTKVNEAGSHIEPQQEVGGSNAGFKNILPYVEVFLPDGKLARQCRASDECPGRYHFEMKRWRMENHLKREHGLEVHISAQKTGRPSAYELAARAKAPQSRVDKVQWHKTTKKRFEDAERKWQINLKKTEHLHRLRATEKWDKLRPEFKVVPKEEFVEKIVKERMVSYLASAAERKARIQKRVDEGYDAHRRLKDVPSWLNVVMDDIEEEKKLSGNSNLNSDEDECEEELPPPRGEDLRDEVSKQESESESEEEPESRSSSFISFGETPVYANPKASDAKGLPLKEVQGDQPCNDALHSEATFSKFATMTLNIDVARDEEGVVIGHRQKLPIRGGTKTHVVIDVSSPATTHEAHIAINFTIQSGQIKVDEQGGGRVVTTRGNIAAARLSANAEITFTSTRFKLSVAVDQTLVNGILQGEASSRTLNLFGQWMEHILPPSILKKVFYVDTLWFTMSAQQMSGFLSDQLKGVDVSEMVFCFWPVVFRHHWSLFVLYVNRGGRLLRLPGKKHYLLYFDSLGLTNPFECLPSVESGLRSLAKAMGDVSISHALSNRESEIELKIVYAPQQPNGHDCGFYVMKYIRNLIAGGLEERPRRSWLTREWFDHSSVCQMRRDLHDWCMECLAEI